jgi:hypothetical protein
MVFLEPLPPQCPPPEAADMQIDTAYRIVPCSTPTIEHFFSHAQLGMPVSPATDPCRARSCSLFLDREKAVEVATKFPKTRMETPHLASVTISDGDGRSTISKKKHVDFWAARSFDPGRAVVGVEPLRPISV